MKSGHNDQENLTIWSVSGAKENLSALLAAASNNPQAIKKRNDTIAVVISYNEYQKIITSAQHTKIAEIFAEARQIAAEEAGQLLSPPRSNRSDIQF